MQRSASDNSVRPARSHRRSGIATVWIIASVPAIVTLLILIADIGTLWLARYELETATEAAALAAVKEWKATNNTNLARIAAQQFAATNTVLIHKKVILTSNGGGGGVNDNSQCNGDILLGQITSAGDFQSSVAPSSTNYYGAIVRDKIQVKSLTQVFGGISFGPYYIHAESVAQVQFDAGGTPRLVRPASIVCP